ncbi:MAG TPA: isoprenylcysteine carboxylmethyltransferase family protein [Thermoanaerobaculia bacterium]|nr:isoprenylcysteine carboxylmethyltransferase family protein [Thermoanaerobaculia bacterium]
MPQTRRSSDSSGALLRPAVIGVYAVFVLEILFMISPFALHFYAAYGPVLNLLHASPSTAWLTSFFLPHYSTTGLFALDRLATAGQLVALAGLAAFLIGFVHIYGAKLTGRGAVGGGLYRAVRHPQYTALVVAGVGTLMVWPRFLVLVSLVTMAFLYGWIARREEALCRERFGEAYRAIELRTGRFLPRALEERLARLLPGRVLRGWRRAATCAVALVLAVGIAFALRSWSLGKVSTLLRDDLAVVSPAPLDQERIASAVDLAIADQEVARRVGDAEPLLVYVLPQSWHLADIPAEPLPPGSHGHDTPSAFDRDRLKVLFTRARTHFPASRGREILLRSYGRDPLALAFVDLARGAVERVEQPMEHVLWGDIPTPLF